MNSDGPGTRYLHRIWCIFRFSFTGASNHQCVHLLWYLLTQWRDFYNSKHCLIGCSVDRNWLGRSRLPHCEILKTLAPDIQRTSWSITVRYTMMLRPFAYEGCEVKGLGHTKSDIMRVICRANEASMLTLDVKVLSSLLTLWHTKVV